MDTKQVVVKKCGCGRQYTAAAFAALPQLGDQVTEDEGGTYALHLANCACGSTIGIEEKISEDQVAAQYQRTPRCDDQQHEDVCVQCGDVVAHTDVLNTEFTCNRCLGIED